MGLLMIIDCISDLHGHQPELPGGDLLIVAGDLTARDTEAQNTDFWRYLSIQDYRIKIVVGGNHDNRIQLGYSSYSKLDDPKLLTCWTQYLCDSGIYSLKIWGSPWTRTFAFMNPHCMAFTLDTEKELAEKWVLIPTDTEILVTHSPPAGILDKCYNGHVGSTSLRERLRDLPNLKLHVFGHIHSGYGTEVIDGVTYVNAAQMDEAYRPVNKPVRVVL